MAITDCFASFPNSRTASRKATQTADTGIVSIIAAGPVNTLVKVANINRTYLTIRNTGTVPIRYGYVDRPTLLVDGELLNPSDAIDIESPQAIYAVCTSGGPSEISWDEGEG